MPTKPLQSILLVDDEADIRAVARIALEAVGGFTVHECASGFAAPAAIAEHAPQLVLMDVMMPGQDGVETLKVLRATPGLAPVPVVFMTAKVQPQEVAMLRSLGAIDVIAKPFDPMTLAQAVRQIWERSKA
jgi:two-component system, OmpR family, response regulator